MFLFVRLFGALIFIALAHRIIAVDWSDEDDDSSEEYTSSHSNSTNRLLCPNVKCIDDPEPEPLGAIRPKRSHPFYPNYPIRRPRRCCKLSGLRPDDFIRHSTFADSQHKSLHSLIIEDGMVDSISKYWLTEFEPSVFHMINGILKTLSIPDFSGASRMIEFNATRNQIEKLEPNVFVLALNIEIIDLSNNRIAEVSEYAFDNIPKLKVLVLSNNLIAKLDFNSKLISLRVFMIDNNSLTHLNENLFNQSTQLTEICLNNNKLNISKLNVTGLVDRFDMSDNPASIQLDSKNLKIRNSNVKVLNISEIAVSIDASFNHISSIVVHPKNVLVELNLSGNIYSSMRNLTVLKSIERLDLSSNRITDINVATFSQMSRLKWLNLESSGLKSIDFGLFSQQQSLNWLDISYNYLKVVDFNKLASNISELFIEGNELTTIDVTDLNHTLPHLQVLGLSINKFSCEKLIEIRRILKSHSVRMHVDEQQMVKFSSNLNGISCVSENNTQTIEFRSPKLLPIHTNNSDHNQFIESIHSKINEIEANIREQSDSFNENSISSKDNILSMKQELMNIRNDGELKIIDAKADILMSISRLFNVSTNDTNVNVDLKSTVEELNKINLERYQSLSLELKAVKDELQDLTQSMANLRITEVVDAKPLKRNSVVNDDSSGAGRSSSSNDDLSSLKTKMTFVVVTVICLIFGFASVLLYKRFFTCGRRRYISTNTINTNVDQSLV